MLTNAFGLVQGTYQYQSGFKEQDGSNLCTPLDGGSSLRCRDIAVGAPAKQIKLDVSWMVAKSQNGNSGL